MTMIPHAVAGPAIVMGAISILAGCTPRGPWVKENANAETRGYDVSWCRGAAEIEVGYLDDDERYLYNLVYMETFDACMRERGWRREGEESEQ